MCRTAGVYLGRMLRKSSTGQGGVNPRNLSIAGASCVQLSLSAVLPLGHVCIEIRDGLVHQGRGVVRVVHAQAAIADDEEHGVGRLALPRRH